MRLSRLIGEKMLESSLTTYHNQIIDYSVGTPVTVEFNFERIWEFKRSLKEEFQPHLLNFYHVHPKGLITYSRLDEICMEGFFIAFGYPIYFAIITFSNSDLFDISVQYNAFEYPKKDVINKTGIECLTNDQLLLLKFLSYGVMREK